jgi:hypothetical protein
MHLRANPCSEDRIALTDLIYRNRLVKIPPRCLLVLRCSPENVDLSAFLRLSAISFRVRCLNSTGAASAALILKRPSCLRWPWPARPCQARTRGGPR